MNRTFIYGSVAVVVVLLAILAGLIIQNPGSLKSAAFSTFWFGAQPEEGLRLRMAYDDDKIVHCYRDAYRLIGDTVLIPDTEFSVLMTRQQATTKSEEFAFSELDALGIGRTNKGHPYWEKVYNKAYTEFFAGIDRNFKYPHKDTTKVTTAITEIKEKVAECTEAFNKAMSVPPPLPTPTLAPTPTLPTGAVDNTCLTEYYACDDTEQVCVDKYKACILNQIVSPGAGIPTSSIMKGAPNLTP